MQKIIVLAFAACSLSACSPTPPTPFNKLKITDIESGIVARSSVANPPSLEGEVTWERTQFGVTAYTRKRLSCPEHASRSLTWIVPREDKIMLCYKLLIDQPDQVTTLNGACPQDLIIKYEMSGIPAKREPKFEVSDACNMADAKKP